MNQNHGVAPGKGGSQLLHLGRQDMEEALIALFWPKSIKLMCFRTIILYNHFFFFFVYVDKTFTFRKLSIICSSSGQKEKNHWWKFTFWVSSGQGGRLSHGEEVVLSLVEGIINIYIITHCLSIFHALKTQLNELENSESNTKEYGHK